jgi:transposase
MGDDQQGVLFADLDLRQRSPVADDPPAATRKARVRPIDRNQFLLRPVDVERLIEPLHPARAIWELLGRRDLSGFYAEIDAVEGSPGRPPIDPQLMLSLWIYGYMDGIPSAREIARQCEYNPAYQWLTGADTVCAHALSDYRTAHAAALKDLAAQILALLNSEGMVEFEQVTLDGTKVRASAGSDTFRREATLERHLEQAQLKVEALESSDGEELSQRTMKARERAARERLQRMERGQKELAKIRETRSAGEKAQARVSLTDPEARIMKQNDGGYAPSYNVQVTTDTQQKVIVSVEVTQEGGDSGQLQPAMERLQQEVGRLPQQAIVDGGYTTRENIVKVAAQEIDLVGPPLNGEVQKETLYQIRGVATEYRPEAFGYDAAANQYTCPEGKILRYKSRQVLVGQTKYTYVADGRDCAACPQKARCCPTSRNGRQLVRAEDAPEVAAFRAKMETTAAKDTYRKRGAVAEFPHLWIKEKFGLRRFSVRGLQKVRVEALWVCLTYNIAQWIRLCWRRNLAIASRATS